MSIAAHISSLVSDGRLHLIEPLDASLEVKRTMVVSDEVQELMAGPWSTLSLERRANRLRADLESFVMGQVVPVSMTPYQHKAAYMGLLDPPERGFWDIRSRDPNPGLRVFGQFADVDLFVALVWHPRSIQIDDKPPLGSARGLNWELAKLQCEEAWQDLFPSHRPRIREKISDLISQDAILV